MSNYHCFMSAESDIEASTREEALLKFRDSLDYHDVQCFEDIEDQPAPPED